VHTHRKLLKPLGNEEVTGSGGLREPKIKMKEMLDGPSTIRKRARHPGGGGGWGAPSATPAEPRSAGHSISVWAEAGDTWGAPPPTCTPVKLMC